MKADPHSRHRPRVGACRFVSAEEAGVLFAAIDAIDLTYSDGRIRFVAVFE